ncbi:MAG: TonB-dependent receptor [Acidobacteria bacterium]|nr:TonB-dependent receptor [Acidobacteriota bacterium]
MLWCWMLIFGDLPIGEKRIQLVGSLSDFSGWTLVLENGESQAFSVEGSIALNSEQTRGFFEVRDGQNQVRYIGRWNDFSQNPIQIQVDNKSFVHEVVSVNRYRQSSFHVPAQVSAFDLEKDSQAFQQTSDVLKQTASIHLQKTNLGGGSPILRGVSGNRVLLNLDGFRLNNGTFRLGLNQYLNTVPLGFLQSMEVLQGPSGVQFGSDGLGGTVFMRSSDPFHAHPRLAYTGSVSSGETSQTHQISGSYRSEQWAVQAFGFFRDHGDLRAGGSEGVQDPTGFKEAGAGLQVAWQNGQHNRLKLNVSGTQARHVPRSDRVISGRDLQWDYHPQDLTLTSLIWENQSAWQGADSLEAGIAFMNQDEGTERISARSPQRQDLTRDTVDNQQFFANFHKGYSWGQLNYGLDYAEDDVTSEAFRRDLETGTESESEAKYPPGAAYSVGGLYAMADVNWGGGWFAQVGTRYATSRFEGRIDPPIGAVKRHSNALVPRLFLGRSWGQWFVSGGFSGGFRSPSLEDSLALGFSSLGLDVPNPDLGPEYVDSLEVTARWRGASSWVQAFAYWADYREFVDRVPGTYLGQSTYQGEPVFMMANVGAAAIRGMSLEWEKDVSRGWLMGGDIAYTYGEQDSGEPTTRSTPLRGNLFLLWQGEKWQSRLMCQWADHQDRLSEADRSDARIPEGGTPGYGVLHWQVDYPLNPHVSFQGRVENLADKVYKVHGSGIYESGRRVTLGVRARLR